MNDDNKIKIILRLFPYIKDKSLASGLLIDDEAIHFISVREFAKQISVILHENLKKVNINSCDAVITDAMACVGGNTISFAKNFKFIYAIEIDKCRTDYLVNNINIYELNNIKTINDDCLNILPKIVDHNVIFIDPPWGGKSYKNEQKLRLSISDVPIECICNRLMNPLLMAKVPEIIILKLPRNYDITHFYRSCENKKIYMYDLIKMIILVIIITDSPLCNTTDICINSI